MSRYNFDREQLTSQGTQSSIAGTGAVSRYQLSRSQIAVTVQDFNCRQMSVSGCKNHYETVLGAGAKAKSVTSLLTLPSVLGFRAIFFDHVIKAVFSEFTEGSTIFIFSLISD